MNRAATSATDGIVQFELSLDEGREVEHVVACLRAGALAWGASPFHGVTDMAFRKADVGRVLAVADEIEAEARATHERRQAAYRKAAKKK